MVASVELSCACAREVSSSVPRPASSRALVRFSVARWFSTFRRATSSWLCWPRNSKYVRATSADDHHLRVAQVRFGALRIGRARLDVAADAAEEIELPDGIEAGVVELRVRRPATRRGSRGSELLLACSRRDAVIVGARSNLDSPRAARASLKRASAMRRSWFAASASSTSVFSVASLNCVQNCATRRLPANTSARRAPSNFCGRRHFRLRDSSGPTAQLASQSAPNSNRPE